MLEALHFLRPWWLLGLIPVALLCILWARVRASGSHWESRVAPELLAVLLEGSISVRRTGRVWALAAGLALATVGLAGPAWERLPQPVTQRTDATVIVLDLSLSMFAEDVAPSRLIRSRQKVTDMLRLRQEGVTGLVAYAGDAHIVSPLTDDTRTISNLLDALSPAMMPVLGSDAESAIALARDLFSNAGLPQGRIVLLTDEVTRPSEVARFRDPRFPISILGIGTPRGATIPLDFVNQPGQVLTDQQGTAIVARLDEQALAALADVTHGRYRTLELQDFDILDLLDTPLPSVEQTLEVEREFDTWADRGYWVCLLLLPLALFGFRRGVLACLCLLMLPPAAFAGWWDDLWARRDQQAHQALEQGSPERAAALFEHPQWRATARYRNDEHAAAANGFAADPSATGAYNLGNALAKQGEFERAIAAYAQALAADPQHEDAAFNKALVERLLKEQQAAQENDPQQESGQGQERDTSSDSQPSGGGEPPDSDDEAQADAENEQSPGDQSPRAEPGEGQRQQETAQSRDEQQDALEQWLRRVPDDPGGLLRRKFRYETNQRLRQGNYREQRAEQVW